MWSSLSTISTALIQKEKKEKLCGQGNIESYKMRPKIMLVCCCLSDEYPDGHCMYSHWSWSYPSYTWPSSTLRLASQYLSVSQQPIISWVTDKVCCKSGNFRSDFQLKIQHVQFSSMSRCRWKLNLLKIAPTSFLSVVCWPQWTLLIQRAAVLRATASTGSNGEVSFMLHTLNQGISFGDLPRWHFLRHGPVVIQETMDGLEVLQ